MLNLLSSKKQLGTFCQNRILEMKEDTDIQYHFISTKENPADIASRGASACELQHNRLWWHCPDWMVNTREAWPVWNFVDQSEEERSQTESEFRKTNIYLKLN